MNGILTYILFAFTVIGIVIALLWPEIVFILSRLGELL